MRNLRILHRHLQRFTAQVLRTVGTVIVASYDFITAYSIVMFSFFPITQHLYIFPILTVISHSYSKIPIIRHLKSACCCQLVLPRHQRSSFSCQAFAVAGQRAWNSLYLSFCQFQKPLENFPLLSLLAQVAHVAICN